MSGRGELQAARGLCVLNAPRTAHKHTHMGMPTTRSVCVCERITAAPPCGSSRSLSIQFNSIQMSFIGMTIVTMYCQSIVFTLNIEQICI